MPQHEARLGAGEDHTFHPPTSVLPLSRILGEGFAKDFLAQSQYQVYYYYVLADTDNCRTEMKLDCCHRLAFGDVRPVGEVKRQNLTTY